MSHHKRRSERRSERGAAAVEFALVVPILITLVFGMVDFGWAVNRYAAVGNAAREGVRVASLGGTSADVTSAVTAYTSGIGGSNPATTVTVSCVRPPTMSACTYASATSGDIAVVTVTYTVDWLTPVGPTVSRAPKLTVSKESRMRIE